MTKAESDNGSKITLQRGLIGTVAGISLLLILPYLIGFIVGTLEHGRPSTESWVTIIGLSALSGMIIILAVTLWPRTKPEPVAQSTKKARLFSAAAIGFGMALGLFFALAEGPDNNPLFSNQPVSSMVALVGALSWAVVVPAVTWLWYKSTDEHDAGAYQSSATLAAHAYAIVVPVWWLAARAGWIPEQDPMIVFAGFCAVWGIAYLIRKYL